VPLFDMVFHDCITIHGKYGYEPVTMAEQVIHHAAMGRTLYYHSVDDHLYWQATGAKAEAPFPPAAVDPALYTRAHQGWAEDFCLWDRFMKNTQEILGPLYKLTAQAWIEEYRFLDAGRLVRCSTFSNGVKVWVNGSTQDFNLDHPMWNKVILPPYGMLVDAPGFVALVAKSWNGHTYSAPVLFTLTAQDQLPLHQSKRLRVFHGFGEDTFPWKNSTYRIRREMVIK
jgi:hypothetical protein